jgi:hypothetical protein
MTGKSGESFPSWPGTHLLWQHKGGRSYLKDEFGLVPASTPSGWISSLHSSWVMAGSGRRYSNRSNNHLATEEIAELDASHGGPEFLGEFRTSDRNGRIKLPTGYWIWEDAQSGEVVLRTSGINYNLRADARIRFPDGHWLTFPVRRPPGEYNARHAVMNAESGQQPVCDSMTA